MKRRSDRQSRPSVCGWGLLMGFLVMTQLIPANAGPLLRVVRSESRRNKLLANGDFEIGSAKAAEHWVGWQQGYHVAVGQGMAGSRAVMCESTNGQDQSGASQTLVLNRTNTAPLVISGWSKAEKVTEGSDSGYSLYVDLIYADGTPLWGQTVNFSCGTHDWERREFVLLPDKPVKELTLHCLFRGHAGKVWFDDAAVGELDTPGGATLFQGVAVQAPTGLPKTAAPSQTLSTKNGLKLGLREDSVVSLEMNGQDCRSPAPGGFMARDVAANSDFFSFEHGNCAELGLSLTTHYQAEGDHVKIWGHLQDTRRQDRAITLVFALPIAADGWVWSDDMRRTRTLQGRGEFANQIRLPCGATGSMSRYPLGTITGPQAGVALALDMTRPAQYRLGYQAGLKQLFIAYDFGLAPDNVRGPGGADFSFIVYTVSPRWKMRSALEKLYEIYPDQFVRRVKQEGLWMPFTDIAKVPGWEDFGFAFQEGAPDVPFDDAHDIASFFYVEPMSHWLPMPPEAPRSYEGALEVLKHDRSGARGYERQQMALATLSSGTWTVEGRYALHLQKAPWCDGALFFLNPNPALATNQALPVTKATVMQADIAAAFRKHQPPTNADSSAGLDGVYLDSWEMAAEELDYRREHLQAAQTPLVFDPKGRLCMLMAFSTWEFTRNLAAQMHAQGKLTFANGVLWKYPFAAPLLDVLGTEVNWLHAGRYQPDSDEIMCFRRALCGTKPYCLLMNTDYSQFTPELVERYFQRCLFYGMWPSFFDEAAASKDPYWASTQRWYDRDRPLFKKYIPLLKQLTAAGWQPVTGAASDNPHILVERFGHRPGTVFLTLHNDCAEPQTGLLHMEGEPSRGPVEVSELVAGESFPWPAAGLKLSLAPQQTKVLRWR